MDKHVHDRIKLFPKRKLTSTPRLALAIANSCNFLNNMNIEKIKDYRRCCCSGTRLPELRTDDTT